MRNLIPVMEREGFIVCFQAVPESNSLRHHFVDECGWSEKEFSRIKNYPWFVAEVSAWRDGVKLGEAHLGACCYKEESEFYTKYRDDYFKQMVEEAITVAKSKLSELADPDGKKLKRDHGYTRADLCRIVSDVYSKAYQGNVYCCYNNSAYNVGGSKLPAAEGVKHLYPNGWSMHTVLSEEGAINIATGKVKLVGFTVEVAESHMHLYRNDKSEEDNANTKD